MANKHTYDVVISANLRDINFAFKEAGIEYKMVEFKLLGMPKELHSARQARCICEPEQLTLFSLRLLNSEGNRLVVIRID